MAEWVKIVLGTCSGLAVGVVGALLLEPLKQRVLRRGRAKKARREIYRELGYLYFFFVLMTEGSVTDPQALLEDHIRYLRLDAYEYYYNQQREVFYDIPDWIALKNMRELLDETRHEMVRNARDADDTIEDVLRAFTSSYQVAGLDLDELKKHAGIWELELEKQFRHWW